MYCIWQYTLKFLKKYQCPCCGCFTYNVPLNEDCGDICPVCFWENDPFITSDDEPSDSNHGITLNEAIANYLRFGACEEEMLCYVRPSKSNEKRSS
ncbi:MULTISPECIES: CPCC family cysteine-rich protein [Blautia]|uniref:CPCC family cysteine-rich protein n=1 Tax=Blautia TaxID=572511 RepID=UPI001FA94783|nr:MULTISPECIES: CPCC family cysteine-rich protein [Blautia]